MSLAAGSRIGPYEVAAQIGAGGMGEVYLGAQLRARAALVRARADQDPEIWLRHSRVVRVESHCRAGGPGHLRRLDIMPEGAHFVGIWPEDLAFESSEVERRIVISQNWSEELKRQMSR
jgi:hypothetical protein